MGFVVCLKKIVMNPYGAQHIKKATTATARVFNKLTSRFNDSFLAALWLSVLLARRTFREILLR